MRTSLPASLASLGLAITLAACGGGGDAPPSGAAAEAPQARSARAARPNIVVILADDLGYADLGVMGSEIRTPHLDKLAKQGRLLTDFNTAPVCAPSRAMLITGTDAHLTGLALPNGDWVGPQIGQPGYEGYLNSRVVSVASLLKDAGYHTYMAGKWDLSAPVFDANGVPTGEFTSLPSAKGFEESFTFQGGGTSHFADRTALFYGGAPRTPYFENGVRVTQLPADYYSSDFFTSKLISQIDKYKGDGKPFFGYLAFTAPHWPLQAPADWVDRYKGRYDAGYEALRAERVARMKQRGLLPADFMPPPLGRDATPWSQLSAGQKRVEARKMEIYAAMVENLDHNVGRLIAYLKEQDQWDNTLIVFAADNGAEGQNPASWVSPLFTAFYGPEAIDWFFNTFDHAETNIGRPGSYAAYGPGWASASVGPGRLSKFYTAAGGVRAPAIVRFPKDKRKGSIDGNFMTLMDLAPTFLELAGAQSPTTYEGAPVLQPRGRSLAGYFRGERDRPHDAAYTYGVEAYGNRAIRRDQWKMLATRGPLGTDQWELYDVSKDPHETRNLAATHPAVVADLNGRWNQYVSDVGLVMPPAAGTWWYWGYIYCLDCLSWLDEYAPPYKYAPPLQYPSPYVVYGR